MPTILFSSQVRGVRSPKSVNNSLFVRDDNLKKDIFLPTDSLVVALSDLIGDFWGDLEGNLFREGLLLLVLGFLCLT